MVVGLSARSLTMAGPSAVASSSSADLPSAAPTAGRVPRWYTPRRLLALFCAMELLVYGDRGVIASTGVQGDRELGTGIRGDLRLSGAQDGLLSSAFIVGLLLGCPAFAEAAKYANPFRCIAAGLAAWVAALLGCAGATSFTQLLLLRCCAGLGEASFVALASPFIDDASPRGAKTKWLACFLACIPTGYAFGIVFGQARRAARRRCIARHSILVLFVFTRKKHEEPRRVTPGLLAAATPSSRLVAPGRLLAA